MYSRTLLITFLTGFVQGSDPLPLTINGDSSSSSFASLVPGLEGISLSADLPAMDAPPILTHVNVFITLDTLVDNLVSVNFDVTNPLDAPLHISFSQSDSGVNGKTYAIFSQPFSDFTVPPHSTANSGTFGNVLLVNGRLSQPFTSPRPTTREHEERARAASSHLPREKRRQRCEGRGEGKS